ncbi:MAG: hypothetical protein J2P36_12225 [Ktedonobacteraceae bacterium]|nr:hypothetical protein [Ktedonobacteraceae bacterium]
MSASTRLALPHGMPARRGAGWMAGQADIGWSNRWGWYEGFHLPVSIAQQGMITGYGLSSASTHDQCLLETLLVARVQPTERLSSAGEPAQGCDIADKGFAGDKPHRRWREQWGAEVMTPPHQRSKRTWPKEKNGGDGLLTCVKASSRCLTSCSTPFAWSENPRTR